MRKRLSEFEPREGGVVIGIGGSSTTWPARRESEAVWGDGYDGKKKG